MRRDLKSAGLQLCIFPPRTTRLCGVECPPGVEASPQNSVNYATCPTAWTSNLERVHGVRGSLGKVSLQAAGVTLADSEKFPVHVRLAVISVQARHVQRRHSSSAIVQYVSRMRFHPQTRTCQALA